MLYYIFTFIYTRMASAWKKEGCLSFFIRVRVIPQKNLAEMVFLRTNVSLHYFTGCGTKHNNGLRLEIDN